MDDLEKLALFQKFRSLKVMILRGDRTEAMVAATEIAKNEIRDKHPELSGELYEAALLALAKKLFKHQEEVVRSECDWESNSAPRLIN